MWKRTKYGANEYKSSTEIGYRLSETKRSFPLIGAANEKGDGQKWIA